MEQVVRLAMPAGDPLDRKAIKSVRLSVTDFGFNGSFVRLALPKFNTYRKPDGDNEVGRLWRSYPPG